MRLGKTKVLTVLVCMAFAMPLRTSAAVLVYEDEDDYYEETYEEDDDRRRYSRSDVVTGPGVADSADKALQGPVVQTVSMRESYHEEYGIYEESINDLYFLYSNVSNGGITDRPVSIDIPANITYTMEKDGIPFSYVSGQLAGERGTYVLRLSVIVDPTAPLSKQEEYRTTFRFRIQEKLPQSQRTDGSEAPVDAIVVNGSGGAGWGYTGDSQVSGTGGGVAMSGESGAAADGTGTAGPGDEKNSAGGADAKEGELGEGTKNETGENPENGENPETGENPENAENPETGEAQAGETANGPEQGSEPGREDAGAGEGKAPDPEKGAIGGIREQVYVEARDSYLVTMNNGRELVSSVPSGFTGPGSVELIVAEGESCQLFLNDEPVEYIRGNSLVDEGSYRMSLDGDEFAFTIVSSVNQMELYPAPLGHRFVKALRDEEELKLSSGRYVPMEEDGVYHLVMEGEGGASMEFDLIKDTQAPEAAVTVGKGTASIQYLSEDISRIILERDGEVVEGFAGYQISQPGSYRLTVADQAGNESTAFFTLRYSVNKYGIVAAVLILFTIAGAVVFTVHVKKNMKIR